MTHARSTQLARISGTALLAVAAVVALTTAAAARRGDGSVHVCSRYGSACVSAPVRNGRNGQEIRLPGGTWIECKQDCRNTLREETVDFFETIRERSPGGPFR